MHVRATLMVMHLSSATTVDNRYNYNDVKNARDPKTISKCRHLQCDLIRHLNQENFHAVSALALIKTQSN